MIIKKHVKSARIQKTDIYPVIHSILDPQRVRWCLGDTLRVEYMRQGIQFLILVGQDDDDDDEDDDD